ncbi:unnamed protein product, partial [Polarella glacialis]
RNLIGTKRNNPAMVDCSKCRYAQSGCGRCNPQRFGQKLPQCSSRAKLLCWLASLFKKLSPLRYPTASKRVVAKQVRTTRTRCIFSKVPVTGHAIIPCQITASEPEMRFSIDSSGCMPLPDGNCTFASGAKCFPKGTFFRSAVDGEWIEATKLEQFVRVLSATGALVTAMQVIRHQEEVRDLVTVATEQATLTVTVDHRVMVRRGAHMVTLCASMLRTSDHVYIADGVAVRVKSLLSERKPVEVVEVYFYPDLPVASFQAPPASILSKGAEVTRPSIRRSGKRPRLVRDDPLSLGVGSPSPPSPPESLRSIRTVDGFSD